MWNVWSAQKCQRLRVNPKGWELDTARGREGERERGTHTQLNLHKSHSKQTQTNIAWRGNACCRFTRRRCSAMFSVWLAQLSSSSLLLLRCSLACVVRSAYFSYCLRVALALSEFRRRSWVKFTYTSQGCLTMICTRCFLSLECETVPRSLENIALRQRLWFAGLCLG